jgi:hypothetical protein
MMPSHLGAQKKFGILFANKNSAPFFNTISSLLSFCGVEYDEEAKRK